MDVDLIRDILALPIDELDIWFKHQQQEVLRKLIDNEPHNENQKRYLRGSIKRKIDTLSSLLGERNEGELIRFLNGIENYYITGFSALKHNGFGWYFVVKRICVTNTRIEGSFHIPHKLVKLKRYRSIKNRSFLIDERTGLRYATNEQILKDAIEDGDEALKRECLSHLKRYGELFIKDHERYLTAETTLSYEPEDFGV